MSRNRAEAGMRRMVVAALIVLVTATSARAQSVQFWPEISAFKTLSDSMRFYVLATTVKEDRTSTEGEFGPNVDFYLHPVANPKRLRGVLDESKHRYLLLRVGYRYLNSFSDGPDEHRAVLEATGRYPVIAGVLLSLRNRIDLRSIDSEGSWRFRTRLSVEHEYVLGRVRMNPYVRGEVYYDNRFKAWSRTDGIVGAAFPLRRHVELEGYFSYQNDTGGESNRQVSAVGTVMNLYF